MHDPHIGIGVECYAGYRGEETPRRLLFGDRAVEVAELLDQWLAPDHRYFKVRGNDRATYLVRQDGPTGDWALVTYERGAPQP